MVEQTQRELEAERESLRLENERMLDQRMTDEVKVLKRELDEQKRKRTEAEEHIKCLLEVRRVLGDKYRSNGCGIHSG